MSESEERSRVTDVLVKNLSESVTEEDLKRIFGEFGSITSTVVMRHDDGTSKCLGFVDFENPEDADRAAESINGKEFDDGKWVVEGAQERSEIELESKFQFGEQAPKDDAVEGSQNSKLYVTHLGDSIDEEKLKELFSPFGSITSCRVLMRRNWKIKGSGIVEFSTPEEASKAISEMNGKMIGDTHLYVAFAETEEERRARFQDKLAPMRQMATAGLGQQEHQGQRLEPGAFMPMAQEHQSPRHGTGVFIPVVHPLNPMDDLAWADSSGQSLGYGYVQYATAESSRSATENLNGTLINREKVHVGRFVPKEERTMRAERSRLCTVHVKNLSESVTGEDLKKIFGEFGSITSTVVVRNQDFGLVEFRNHEDAAKAIASLNGKEFFGKKWLVERSQKKHERVIELLPNQKLKLYVRGLHVSYDDDKFRELFTPFGSITSCKLLRDQSGMSKRSGFVAFSSPEEASTAISEMNGKRIANRRLYVAYAETKDDRRGRLQMATVPAAAPAAVAPVPAMQMYSMYHQPSVAPPIMYPQAQFGLMAPQMPMNGVGQQIFYGQQPPPAITYPQFIYPMPMVQHQQQGPPRPRWN